MADSAEPETGPALVRSFRVDGDRLCWELRGTALEALSNASVRAFVERARGESLVAAHDVTFSMNVGAWRRLGELPVSTDSEAAETWMTDHAAAAALCSVSREQVTFGCEGYVGASNMRFFARVNDVPLELRPGISPLTPDGHLLTPATFLVWRVGFAHSLQLGEESLVAVERRGEQGAAHVSGTGARRGRQ